MTCIVGLELGGGRVLFGADSMDNDGASFTLARSPKIWQAGDYIIGAAGHSYMCDWLQFCADLPKRVTGDPERWLRSKLIPALECILRGIDKSGDDERHGVDLLIGLAGMVFVVSPRPGEAIRAVDGFGAIGNGSEVAIGSLYTTARLEGFVPEPSDRIEMAINAAASRCLGVGGPIVMLEGKASSGRKPHGNAKADSRGVRASKGNAARKKPRIRR